MTPAARTYGGAGERHLPMLNALLAECLRQANSPHEKTRALARELLNDWDTFWVVLDHPELPLTNNEASVPCAIGSSPGASVWVPAPRGTRVFALLASVIETCRRSVMFAVALPDRGAAPKTQGAASATLASCPRSDEKARPAP